MKRSWIAAFAILACLSFAWATGAGRPHPASADGVIDPTCTSSLPCIEYDNNGSGPGIRGISVSGNGLAGSTKNHSTSSVNGRAGLIGNDVGTGVFNSGVHGLSVGGAGVSGNSTNGTGVTGQSTNGPGLTGMSTNNDGIDGFTTNPSLTNSPRSGVFGLDESSDGGHRNGGVVGFSTNGVGVAGNAANGVGVDAVGGVIGGDPSTSFPALSVVGTQTGDLNNELIDACPVGTANPCNLADAVFILDHFGSIVIAGRIYTSGTCHNGCAPSPSTGEKRVRLFTPQESLPTVEDFGEGQLVGGRTYVRIDPAFANTMDNDAAYMVIITPEGDSSGLYVVNKTAAGFEVHENRGGRSTLAFSYRILAKPFGEHPVRLQMITLSRPGTSLHQPRIR